MPRHGIVYHMAEYRCFECGYEWRSRSDSKPFRCGRYECRTTAWEFGRAHNAAQRKTHGHATPKTSTYSSWLNMKQRVTNPNNPRWKDYGGRGVKMAKRWFNFENFLADMGEKPTPKHSIDRYPDRDGDYKPSNCRWASPRQQQNNMRGNHRITYQGVTQALPEWAKQYGLNQSTLAKRLRRGFTIHEALTKEPAKARRVSPAHRKAGR